MTARSLPRFLTLILPFFLALCPRSNACARSCSLRFCGGPSRAYIGAAHTPATPAVCKSLSFLRYRPTIRGVGPAHIRLRGRRRFVRASKLGLVPIPFKPVLAPLRVGGGSALALSPLVSNVDRQRLHGACVIVPVRSWHYDRSASPSSAPCVSFRVSVTDIRVDLEWDSRDDLDVFVTQPDGRQVFFQPTSTKGRLLRDDNRRACGRRSPGGLETVVYEGALQLTGAYKVFAEHTRNCGKGSTTWRLRIAVQGRIVHDIGGTTNLPLGGVIEDSRSSFNFTV
ncbi:hypothetical protein BWQ96_06139 [Gracilariopsis chorda]|uniref:Uncharacterized protein n=1 Tax=Gracilariopsis chorda TaxID=448386 RepID=A0A2V3IPQ5_9FLOR|nr:hypothetical protein BWQ96_06139 [Gracilariopsis chorda]|eukprot:PXF44058.1 hypothetical protein BWQ96_06139 [Gracilariopsis chorda]